MRKIESNTNFGTIYINLKKLMDENNISISEMSRKADMKYDVVKKYYYNDSYSYSTETLAKFCYVLECDIKLVRANGPIRILGLERPMTVEICGHSFTGKIDRIDSFRDGMVRVVDYKTGRDRQGALALDEVAEAFNSENKAALQFFVYDRMIEASPEFAGKSSGFFTNCREIFFGAFSFGKIFSIVPSGL